MTHKDRHYSTPITFPDWAKESLIRQGYDPDDHPHFKTKWLSEDAQNGTIGIYYEDELVAFFYKEHYPVLVTPETGEEEVIFRANDVLRFVNDPPLNSQGHEN